MEHTLSIRHKNKQNNLCGGEQQVQRQNLQNQSESLIFNKR